MRLLMLGPPGAGKGTQAARLARHFGIRHIASGELLRREVAEKTPLGQLVSGYLERGEYSPSLDLVLRIAEFFALPVEAIFSRKPFAPLVADAYLPEAYLPSRSPRRKP